MAQQVQAQEEAYRNFFKEADTDGSGTLTIQELKSVLEKKCKSAGDRTLEDSEIADMIADLDKNGDGIVSLGEYLDALLKTPRKQAFTQVFKSLDTGNTGKLTKDQVGEFCTKAVGVLPPEKIEKMFKDADINGDGTIDLEEFLKLM